MCEFFRETLSMQLKAILTIAVLALTTSVASAATVSSVLGVSGPADRSTPLGVGLPDVGVAQTFTTNRDLTNASFDFEVQCLLCAGELWLIEGQMSRSVLNRNVVARESYSGSSEIQSALSGLSFAAGQYTIIMTMTTGQGLWRATETPKLTGTAGIFETGSRSFSKIDPNFLPWSSTTFLANQTLLFNIGADAPVSPVPLPASAGFLLLGLLGMAGMGRLKAR